MCPLGYHENGFVATPALGHQSAQTASYEQVVQIVIVPHKKLIKESVLT